MARRLVPAAWGHTPPGPELSEKMLPARKSHRFITLQAKESKRRNARYPRCSCRSEGYSCCEIGGRIEGRIGDIEGRFEGRFSDGLYNGRSWIVCDIACVYAGLRVGEMALQTELQTVGR